MPANDTTPRPRGLWAMAQYAAAHTPPSRNRAVDLYRAVAICMVVLGHWLLIAPMVAGGEVQLTILLAEAPWTQYATWLFQIMPVFFFVGGFANAVSWASARHDPVQQRGWAATRLSRLLTPIVPLVLVWAAAAAIAKLTGVPLDLIDASSQAALVPVWFLAVYIVITVVVPVAARVWDALGPASVLLLMAGAIAVDTLAFGFGMGWLRWTNYGFIWLAVHQLGFWWQSDRHRLPPWWLISALGVVWMIVLIPGLGFPVSMISVPGEEISNTRPPTTAMLAIGLVQIGLLIAIERPIRRWLDGARVWASVILLNQMIMTIYLWHLTAVIALVGLSLLAGGIGLGTAPGTAQWWVLRAPWLLALVVTLVPFVALFFRYESAGKRGPEALPGYGLAFVGALLACAGLVMLALGAIGAHRALGFNVEAIVLVVVGVWLATRGLPARQG
ncbi:acyltransferase family protein [Maliponia aquimaris]|uniref:Acyltransferase family protein n=1 Tax=Maliponia aquimaris TaxID=1673631 RepID=A0A238K8T8_9RHOB|nr:acyltransferase [Maliponia aquimaris]SMX38854.1 Acyltransferase family protein [Maliponia aquimaris]